MGFLPKLSDHFEPGELLFIYTTLFLHFKLPIIIAIYRSVSIDIDTRNRCAHVLGDLFLIPVSCGVKGNLPFIGQRSSFDQNVAILCFLLFISFAFVRFALSPNLHWAQAIDWL